MENFINNIYEQIGDFKSVKSFEGAFNVKTEEGSLDEVYPSWSALSKQNIDCWIRFDVINLIIGIFIPEKSDRKEFNEKFLKEFYEKIVEFYPILEKKETKLAGINFYTIKISS
jgi:hypothetical protein